MPENPTTYRTARLSDLDRLVELIESASLPARFITEFIDGFIVAELEGDIIGCCGIEIYGATAVLRSLVVAEASRGSGIGRSIVERLEDLARSRNVEWVYCYTVDAHGFWQRLGYAEITLEDWLEPAQACWQYQYVNGNRPMFEEMKLRSFTRLLVAGS